jgi:hypothetical protein
MEEITHRKVSFNRHWIVLFVDFSVREFKNVPGSRIFLLFAKVMGGGGRGALKGGTRA